MPRYSTYAPDFRLKIGGDSIPAALRAAIVSITYQDGMEGADRVEVTIANEDLRWLDHPLLQVDNGLKLSLGYVPDPLEEVFVGEITGVETNFPNSGMPTIKLTAHDFLQRLNKGTKDRGFLINIPTVGNFPLPDVVVAGIVAAENLLIPSPDPVGGALSILMTLATYVTAPTLAQQGVARQKGTSDFAFLTEISKKNGWEMFIDHTAEPHGYRLRFKFMLSEMSPTLTLKWGSTLGSFTPRLTTVGDAGISVRVWVASLKMAFTITVAWNFDKGSFDLSISPGFGVPGQGKQKAISLKPTGFAQAPQTILTELLPRLNNRLTGSGSTIGDLRIKASRVINFEGLGEQFSGLYRITSASHTYDGSGFRTNFQVRKEVWFGGFKLPSSPAGLLRIQGQSAASISV
jgi:phage protein D